MKIRETVSNNLELNKYYLEHDLEQYLKGFSHRSDISGSANIQALYLKRYLMKNNFIIMFLKVLDTNY